MSYTRELLYSIADEMGRNRKDMDNFISVLEKNWFDSKESLRSLTIKDFDRFQIPSRLSMIIMQKVGQGSQEKTFSNNSYNSYQPQHNMMQIQQSPKDYIERLQKKVNPQVFSESINTLISLFRNIRDNLTNEKYRTLKKSNKRISNLISIPQNSQLMYFGGFRQQGQFLIMRNMNLSTIDQCLDTLYKYQKGPKFNPYEATVMTTAKNQPKIQGQTSVIYNDKLKQLEDERLRIMSRPIKDRCIKIFQQKRSEVKPDRNWFQDRDATLEQRQYAQVIREKLKNYGQDSKFMNRRKQQYFQLMKKPVFSETIVRVKLPDNWIFQCRFSPMQTLQELIKIFDEHVQNKNISYYLYMTPPVKKLSGLILRQTFYDADCVPSALFYLGSQQEIKQNILRTKKSIFSNFLK